MAIARQVPAVLHAGDSGLRESRVNRIVLAATLVAALTFAVMIGCFYLASQYLQQAAGFSALGASGALVIVALLVGVAAPLAGRLVDDYGERLPAVLGFALAAGGLAVLAIPGLPLDKLVTILPLIPVGVGLGMLFVPTSRAALNATPRASHGRTSAILSVGRLLGAGIGAGVGRRWCWPAGRTPRPCTARCCSRASCAWSSAYRPPPGSGRLAARSQDEPRRAPERLARVAPGRCTGPRCPFSRRAGREALR